MLLDADLLPLKVRLQIQAAGLILFEKDLTRGDEPGIVAIARF